MSLHEGSARMDNTSPDRNKRLFILLAVFGCAFLLAIAAVLTADHRRISWTEGTPPNGTTGSAQPGTIGLARPHPPLPVR
jgi:hypothetical protein